MVLDKQTQIRSALSAREAAGSCPRFIVSATIDSLINLVFKTHGGPGSPNPAPLQAPVCLRRFWQFPVVVHRLLHKFSTPMLPHRRRELLVTISLIEVCTY